MRHILCITSMHRSGTSLLASWIEHCGLNIHNGNVMGAHVGNPKGHFEDEDFVDLHSSAILSEYPSSKNWQVFVDTFLTFSDGHLSMAKKLVSERNKKFNNWGWKDPRSVIFLEQWKAIMPELKVLLIWRPCSEVVHSLAERSSKAWNSSIVKVKIRDSVKLWISYNKRICEYKQKYPDDSVLLHIKNITENDSEVIELLNKKLQLDFKYRPIGDIYDENLLRRKSISLRRMASRVASFYYGALKLEDTLQELSDS